MKTVKKMNFSLVKSKLKLVNSSIKEGEEEYTVHNLEVLSNIEGLGLPTISDLKNRLNEKIVRPLI
jgi:hypothetical protein